MNLKKSEEMRLDSLFGNFAKSEIANMRFSEFFSFALDRGLITTRITLSMFYELFLDCISEEEVKPNKEKGINKS